MKKALIILIALLFIASQSEAKSGRVRGYTKKNGTYVSPHYKTSPDKSKLNNYSTKGNINPYTGKKGTKNPFK